MGRWWPRESSRSCSRSRGRSTWRACCSGSSCRPRPLRGARVPHAPDRGPGDRARRVGDGPMSRRIVHPTDFSTASRAAFAKAVEMAKADRGELLLVHVLSPVMPVPGDGYISPKVYDEIAASTRAWAQKQLDKLLAKAKAAGARVKGLLVEGVPHEQIG